MLTERRLDETVPIGNGAMKDRTFIEWDKDDINALGLMKVDVLALGMLTAIKRAMDMLGIADMADIAEGGCGCLPPCCPRPTPSGCSRSRAGRRCRCCRG